MNVFYRMFRWLQSPSTAYLTHINQPISHWNEALPGLKRLLFNILVFISIAGNIIDLHNVGLYLNHYVNYINVVYILLATTIFLLERLGTIPLHCSTNVVIYALVVNILTSLNFDAQYFSELYMREIIFLGIILILAGIINRNNIIILGIILFTHYIAVLIFNKDPFLVDNAAIMSSIIIGYAMLNYYLLKSFQSGLILQHNLSYQLNQSNKSLDIQKRQLEESETKYRMLAENAGDFIATFNSLGSFTYTSPSVSKILGYSPDALIEQNALNLVHPDDEKEVKTCMEKTIKGDESVCQYRAKKINGTYVWVEAIMQKVNSIENRYITIIRDISIRKQAQIELELANQTKDKFFSIIAHDLKSPMSQIYSSSHLLDEKSASLSDEDKKMLVKNVFTGTEKLSSLLDDLLLWSRSQMNKIPITPENCDLQVLISDCIDLFRNTLEAKDIQIVLNTQNSVLVFADANSVKTVVRNILSNAIKFSHPHSIINFNLVEKDFKVVTKISDNGIGISAERVSSLFEVDKSFSTPGTQEETGTGLGIIICKELIEKNEGSLKVESQLSKGTTFHVILPAGKHK